MTVGTQAFLALALAASSSAVVGQVVTVDLTITNTGTGPAFVPIPQLFYSANLVTLSGPVPAGSVTLTGGAQITYRWTLSPTASPKGDQTYPISILMDDTSCGVVPVTASLLLPVLNQVPGGEWPMWGHDPANTFFQGRETSLRPPLEKLWVSSRPAGAGDHGPGNREVQPGTIPPAMIVRFRRGEGRD